MFSFGKLQATLVAVIALVVAGCGSSSDPQALASLRVLHAVPDAPRVNVFLDDVEVLSEVDFRVGSAFLPIEAGNYDVRVEAILPGGGTTPVIDEKDIPFDANTASTVIAAGTVGGGIVTIPQGESTDEIPAGNLRIKVTHASSAAPPVWVALTAPLDEIGMASFLGPVEFEGALGPIDVPAAEYRVRVIARDPIMMDITDADVVFDSGAIDLSGAEGADLNVVAVTSTVPSIGGSAFAPDAAASPITLVVLDGLGSSDIFDVSTGSFLTIVHDAPGIPAVDVFADITATPETEEVQLTDDLVYGNFEPRQTVPATEYAVGVRLASDNSADAFGFDADLMAGMGYTAIARLVEGAPAAQVLMDDYRSVATESKVRIVHGSPAAGPVDVYVFPTDLDNPAGPASGDPLLENFVYGAETGFVSLVPASYDVLVTLAGTETVAIEVRALAVAAGGVYTAIARDPLPDSGEFGVILIAD